MEASEISPSDVGAAQAEWLLEAISEVRARARRYVQEPEDGAWYALVSALARAYGDSETYDLLRAVEIHSRVVRRG